MTTCVYDFVQHSKDPDDVVRVLRIYQGSNPNYSLRIFNHDGRLVINDFVIDLAGEEMIKEMMNQDKGRAPRDLQTLKHVVEAARTCMKQHAEGTIDYQVLDILVDELLYREQALK